jgi:hypothetical protein
LCVHGKDSRHQHAYQDNSFHVVFFILPTANRKYRELK